MAEIKKERIRDRMLKTAARIWGVPEGEIETNFDPLVTLIIEACAAELEKVGQDINSSQDRLLDRMAEIFIPEAAIGNRPASSIMHALPAESSAEITEYNHFFTSQKFIQSITGSTTSKEIYYTPVGSFMLHKANLEYMLLGNKLVKMHGISPRETLFQGEGNGMVRDIWLAISVDKLVKNLNGLSIYFDMRSHSEASNFYQSLAEVECHIDDEPINMHKGYYNANQFELNIEEILESGHDYSKKVNRIEAGIYEKNFVHIDDEHLIQQHSKKQVPNDWLNLLPTTISNKLNEESLIYIKISLNRMFQQSTVDGLFCSINSFPIINRKLNSINYRTDPLINIVPLPMDEGFLDLQSVTSYDSLKFKYRIAANTNEVNAGEAVVRNTGIGKYNSQEVREIIDNLMDAIRNESAFFGEVSNDFITARLQEISRIVARLEDQVIQAKDNKHPNYYLLLKPKYPTESVAINYWTTNGQSAKQVKAFTLLSPLNHSIVNAQQSYTLNNSMGGNVNLSNLEKKIILKRQLLSGGRIVSKEDIKLLCYQLFGNKLKQVDINKSVLNGIGAKDGFSKSIEIKITPTKQAEESMQHELNYLARELEQNLQEHASVIFPFRVILNLKSTK